MKEARIKRHGSWESSATALVCYPKLLGPLVSSSASLGLFPPIRNALLLDCSPSGSSVCGDSPGRNTGVGCHFLLQRIFPTQGSSPGLLYCREIFYCLSHQGSPICKNTAAAAAAKSLQSCPTLCDPIDGSPTGSPVPGILQARTLERVAISFSSA